MSDRPLLDIVAGTSIGAINAAIIVSYVVENNTWDGSSDSLNEFWESREPIPAPTKQPQPLKQPETFDTKKFELSMFDITIQIPDESPP